MKETSSPISKTGRYSMSQETEIEKCKMFIFGRDTVVLTRDGELSIMTKNLKRRLRVFTETSDSISTEPSILDQECQ
jgi:hypothetical protein